jgi:hypothetical protein
VVKLLGGASQQRTHATGTINANIYETARYDQRDDEPA